MNLSKTASIPLALAALFASSCREAKPVPAKAAVQAPLQATQLQHIEELPEAKWAVTNRTASQAPGPADTKIFIVASSTQPATARYWSSRPESASITIPDSIARTLGVTALASGRQNPTTMIFRGPTANVEAFTTEAYPSGVGVVAGNLLLMEFFSR